jgi:hypothetical protein
LFSQFEIAVDGVQDLQTLDLAARRRKQVHFTDPAEHVYGESHGPPTLAAEWQITKKESCLMARRNIDDVLKERLDKSEDGNQTVVLLSELYQA